jgi:hypothetical protein
MNKVWKQDGKLYVDTAFLQNSGNVLPNSEVKHMGFGEFYIQTPDGTVQFARKDPMTFDGMSGRCHLLYDDRKGALVTELIIRMKPEIIEV